MKEFRKILKYARPYTKSLVFAFICLTLTSLVNLVLPLIVRNMINAVVILKDSQILDGLAWDLFFIILLQAVFAVTHNYVFGFVGHRMTTDFRIEFFSHIQSLSLRFFQERRLGEILSRMNNDISVIQNALVSIPIALLRQSITLIGAMAIILYLNWKLTGLILLILPPLMIFARVFGKRLRLFSEKLQDQVAQAVVVLEEVASSIKIVKSFTRENYERERFKKEIETAFERAVDKLKISSFFGPFILGLTFMVSAVLIWYGGYQVMSGATTPGELAAFFLYALIVAGPIGTFVRLYTQIQEASGAIRRVYEILDTAPAIDNPENPIFLQNITGRIQFKNVSFSYGQKIAGVNEISLTLEPGEKIGLVGASGAGKSTLVNLLLRLHDPESGGIFIDGQNILHVTQDSLRSQIGMVSQETSMFNRSAKENILYGKPDASFEEVSSASIKAGAHEFIKDLIDNNGRTGYEAFLGERGVKLSGGQRQRIALARAIIKNAPVLVLDEATSALDSEVEATIQKAFEQVMDGKTVLAIAHRLSTLSNMDRIIVLDRGKIVEQGSHPNLLKQNGIYSNFWKRQSGGFINFKDAAE